MFRSRTRLASMLTLAVACGDGSDTPAASSDSTGDTASTSVAPATSGTTMPTSADGTTTTASTGAEASSSSGVDSDDTGSDSTGAPPPATIFCPPEIGPEAAQWRAEFDVFFDTPDSMRRYLDDFPEGSGHWGQTYTLRGLLLMYELTAELRYLHELIGQAQALTELAEDSVTWPTGVCGNSFEHSTVVIDARLITPLLRAAWWMTNSRLRDRLVPDEEGLVGGQTYAEAAQDIATLGAAVLAHHEPELVVIQSEDFGPYEGETSEYYRFSNSYTCVAGDLMPFNYANSAAAAYAALWHLTGDVAARDHAERLTFFWWNRTIAHEPSEGASLSRWWGYRGKVGERFDPDAFPGDADQRPEDVGHADMSASLAADIYALGLPGLNATRIDQVALTSKRWVDRAVADDAPAYYMTGDDTDGEWVDLFDHLPMACYRASILPDLAAEAPSRLTNDEGAYRRANLENLAEFAFYSEFSGTAPGCGPACGDGVCNGPEDCVGCEADCGACAPQACR
ncbi:MAG: hypothetical protein AAF721_19275 [Myxococcota bacterium]